MELRGFEPLTFSLRTRRATNCATAPCAGEREGKVTTETSAARIGPIVVRRLSSAQAPATLRCSASASVVACADCSADPDASRASAVSASS